MDETEYLLSSKANKKHLLDAIKSKKFTRFTSEEFDEYSKQLIKSTMKDKFEKNIKSELGKLLFTDSWIAEIADNINTLHQQAMKEKIKEILQSLVDTYPVNDLTAIYDNINKIAKENNIKL